MLPLEFDSTSLNWTPHPNSDMERLSHPGFAKRMPLILLAIFVGIEATYVCPAGSVLRAIAAWTWMASSVLVLGSALISSLVPFFRRDSWSSRSCAWYLAAFVAPIVLVLFGVTGYAHTQINDEAIQQVAAGLGLLESRRDLGLFSTGFVGYPARQYLLAALPSLVLGRGLIALRIGFGGLFLIGYLSFLSSLRGYLEARKSEAAALLAALAGVLVALGSYPLLYARLFEQTTAPVAAMLFFLAGALRLADRPAPLGALWILWSVGFMPYAYTPALAAWAFCMAVLACLAFTGFRASRPILAAALVYGAAALAVSLLAQVQANLASGRFSLGATTDTGNDSWVYRLSNGLHAAFGLEESLVPAPLALGILFVLLHSSKRRDYRILSLCLWALLTVAVSLLMRGYWRRVPEFDIQRAMIILPPLSLALVLYAASLWPPTASGSERALRVAAASAVLFMLLNASYLPLIRRAPRAYVPFAVTDKEEATMLVVGQAGSSAKTVYLVPPLFIHLEDTLLYFSPATKVVRGLPPAGEHLPGNFVLSYARPELFVPEDSYAQFSEHPVRSSFPRPYLRISAE